MTDYQKRKNGHRNHIANANERGSPENLFMRNHDEIRKKVLGYTTKHLKADSFERDPESTAHDITQQALFITWQKIKKGEMIENHEAYCIGIAKIQISRLNRDDRWRGKTKSLDQEVCKDGNTFPNQLGKADSFESRISDTEQLREVIATAHVSERDKKIVIASSQGFTHREISESLGMSEGATRTAYCRTMKQFIKTAKENI